MLREVHRWFPLALSMLVLVLGTGVVWAQQPEQQAGLVIVGEGGSVTTYCIAFSETQLTGLSLLERADVVLEIRSGWGGTAVCGIDRLGCPLTDCFCQCKTAPCRYWSYFHRDIDGSWRYSSQGAHAWPIENGDVDAWVWGDGSGVPPSLSIDDICASPDAPTPTLAAVLSPSETPRLVQETLPASPGEALSATTSGRATDSPDALGYAIFAVVLFFLVGTVVVRRIRRR